MSDALAAELRRLGIRANDRVAVYLPKLPLTAFSFYATSAAGGVFVPVNPILKPAQVEHILNDCDARVLITSPDRLALLQDVLPNCRNLHHVLLSEAPAAPDHGAVSTSVWQPHDAEAGWVAEHRVDHDMVAILYTSGSTGRPKGVVISHRNIVEGARSVSQYLEITAAEVMTGVLSLTPVTVTAID